MRAFEKSVYTFATVHCVNCHGGHQNPKFAQSDLLAAYAAAKPFANFKDIPQSTFVIRTKNGHCGSACQTDGSAMIELIKIWSIGETAEEIPSPSDGESGDGNDGMLAFKDSVYALARVKCIGCHGQNQSPKFAQDDLAAAYSAAKAFVDFKDLSKSVFVYRTRNGHCGSNCLTDGSEMTNKIKSWWEGEKKAGDPTPLISLVTAPAWAPNDLGSAYRLMTWNLSVLSPDLAGALFEIEVRRAEEGTYRFRKPRILAGVFPLRVEDLDIAVNGHFSTTPSPFSTVEQSLSPGGAPVLSSAEVTLPIEANRNISIRFRTAAKTSSPQCLHLTEFSAVVVPILRQCFECHGPSGDPGVTDRYLMDESNETEFCLETTQRVTRAHPSSSPLISYPNGPIHDHPFKKLQADDVAKLEAWISLGFQRSTNQPRKGIPLMGK